MYPLNEFTPFKGQSIKPDDIILSWSKSTGYCFLKFSEINPNSIVIAVYL